MQDINLLKQQIEELERQKTTAVLQLNKLLDGTVLQPKFSVTEKINIFMNLFKGRTDLFATRWHNLKTNKYGFSPACYNEWHKQLCFKPRISCSNCKNKAFIPLTKELLIRHFTKNFTIGIYPLLLNNSCWFLAVDFDKKSWTEETLAFMETCKQNNVSAYIERSRSGNGSHVWIFFNTAVPAIVARKFGMILLTTSMKRITKLKFTSYDRLFPTQDNIPEGGFGNLIALPLQFIPRKQNNSVFVDLILVIPSPFRRIL